MKLTTQLNKHDRFGEAVTFRIVRLASFVDKYIYYLLNADAIDIQSHQHQHHVNI